MRSVIAVSVLLLCLVAPSNLVAGYGKVIKVLPFFLDKNGLHTLSPSLYERDAYQAQLRRRPEQRTGLMMQVQWKTKGKISAPLRIRVELRGIAQGNLPRQAVIERQVSPTGWFSRWAPMMLTGDDYRNFGEVTAWRVTLWEGDDLLLGEQRSFLW
jgi:hypothetical protein